MPIYEYRCAKCGAVREALQKISDSPLKTCQTCSGPLQKLVSHSSFHLKGSGWYITDYAKSGSPNPSPQAAPADADKSEKTPKQPDPPPVTAS
jgi:putative FmdB family regulatory protein